MAISIGPLPAISPFLAAQTRGGAPASSGAAAEASGQAGAPEAFDLDQLWEIQQQVALWKAGVALDSNWVKQQKELALLVTSKV
jgi:hypothetical protein